MPVGSNAFAAPVEMGELERPMRLALVLLALQLSGTIDVSWWLVSAPLWAQMLVEAGRDRLARWHHLRQHPAI